MPASLRRLVVVDSGPLKAAIDRDDIDHLWAVRWLRNLSGRIVTSEAAITETLHLVENHPVAVSRLGELLQRMEIASPSVDSLAEVLSRVGQFAPRMDYADACAVVLVERHRLGFVLTTDFRDFSVYRVPFASPEGIFYEQRE